MAIRQVVTVGAGGVIQLRSRRLKAGVEAEVIVLLPEPSKRRPARKPAEKSNGARDKSSRKFPVARMTDQVRGDLAEANRIRQAIRQGREKLISWERVKRELGLE